MLVSCFGSTVTGESIVRSKNKFLQAIKDQGNRRWNDRDINSKDDPRSREINNISTQIPLPIFILLVRGSRVPFQSDQPRILVISADLRVNPNLLRGRQIRESNSLYNPRPSRTLLQTAPSIHPIDRPQTPAPLALIFHARVPNNWRPQVPIPPRRRHSVFDA